MNANLLRGVYNEEYELEIDDYGSVSFSGDDGIVTLDDLPDYEPKDYKVANAMMDMGVKAYQNGVILNSNDIMYQNYKNKLNIAIDQGGVPTLMSIIHDGLVGDTKMVNDPVIARGVEQFQAGEISFEDLSDLIDYECVAVIDARSGLEINDEKISEDKKMIPNALSIPVEDIELVDNEGYFDDFDNQDLLLEYEQEVETINYINTLIIQTIFPFY